MHVKWLLLATLLSTSFITPFICATPTRIGTNNGPVSVYLQGRYAYVVTTTPSTLQIFDVNSPLVPTLVGAITIETAPSCISVQGNYAYVINSGGPTLQIFNISDPASPILVGTTPTGVAPTYLYVRGRYAYVINTTIPGLEIFDISNFSAPVPVGFVATDADPRSLYIRGTYAYVVNGSAATLQIFNVSDPTNPLLIGTVTTGAGTIPTSIYVQGSRAYITNGGSSDLLQTFDISDPATPSFLGSITTLPSPKTVYVQENTAYVISNISNSLQLFDISDTSLITEMKYIPTGNDPRSFVVQGNYVYVVNFADNTLIAINLVGTYLQQLEAGGIETGTLQVQENASITNNLDVRGAATFGCGFHATANSSIAGTTDAPALSVIAGAATLESAPTFTNLVSTTGTTLVLNGTSLAILTSSKRFKENIKAIAKETAEKIYQLEPVVFDYKTENGGEKNQIGFVAEQVADVFPDMVNKDREGNVQSIRYESMHALTIQELQQHKDSIALHSIIIKNLLSRIEKLEKQSQEELLKK